MGDLEPVRVQIKSPRIMNTKRTIQRLKIGSFNIQKTKSLLRVTQLATQYDIFFIQEFQANQKNIKFIEYDSKVKQGRMEAYVLIESGTTRTPSFKVTTGKLREKLQVESENWNGMKAEIPFLQKEINHYKDRLDEHQRELALCESFQYSEQIRKYPR